MGTIVNALAIVVGGCLGCMLKQGIKPNIQDAIYKVLGISVLLIGINGLFTNMASVSGSIISTSGEIILIVSLVLGTLIGEWFEIEQKLNQLAKKMEDKFQLAGFANGFIVSSIIFCVGAMAIVGAINDGLLHDPSVLYVKSILDGITSIILAATLGIGVLFSSIPVLLYQGAIALTASGLSKFLVGEFLQQICMVGYALVVCIGVNFLIKDKIRVANMLPSLLIVILYNVLLMII